MSVNRNLLQLVTETAKQEFPFVCLLSCSDSRVVSEMIFDQGLGDIFNIRLLGNKATDDAVESMEYACRELHTRLVVVLGHTDCNVLEEKYDHALADSTGEIMAEAGPHFLKASSTNAVAHKIAMAHVQSQLAAIVDKSSLIRNLLHKGDVGLVGAVYNNKTGRVSFAEPDKNAAPQLLKEASEA